MNKKSSWQIYKNKKYEKFVFKNKSNNISELNLLDNDLDLPLVGPNQKKKN